MKGLKTKRFLRVLAATLLLSISCACFVACDDGGEEAITLYVYNWGEYISDGSEESLDVNAAFEDYCRETLGKNVTVN